jgi:hypothetical protein
MADERGDDAAKGPVSGAELGAHAAISDAGAPAGQLGALADQAAADQLAFEDGLDGFSGQAVAPPVKRGAGRPAGSPNRATSKVREYLLARGYRDPMELQAAIVAADPKELAQALVVAGEAVTTAMVLEVLKLQQKAADALMPYFHQAQPKALEVKVEGARPLFVFGAMAAPKGEPDQRLKDVTPQASQIEVRQDVAQAVDMSDIFGVREHD